MGAAWGEPQKKADSRRPVEAGKAPDRALTPADIPIEASGNPEADAIANLINGFGEVGLTLWHTLDADTIDGIIWTSNQLRQDPEQRLEDYLKRCVEAHYEEKPEQRMADLGVTEDMVVISDRPDPLQVLKRIEMQEGADLAIAPHPG